MSEKPRLWLKLGDVPIGTSVIVKGYERRGTGEVLGVPESDPEAMSVQVFQSIDGGGIGIYVYPASTLALIDQFPESGTVTTIVDQIRKSIFKDLFRF